MRPLIVYFSFTGNNRTLAEQLAARLGCELCPVVETRKRRGISILWDMLFDRTPPVAPLAKQIADYDHVVLLAPIWDAKVAHPMKSLLLRERGAIRAYTFVSLCGYERPEQARRVTEQLRRWTGREPAGVFELRVCDLFPLGKRNHIPTISRYRITAGDLPAFEERIQEIVARVQAA